MYEDFITALKDIVADFSGLTHHDFGCNCGYLCYRLLQEGVKASSGNDRDNYSETFSILNKTLGLNATYIKTKYDSTKHQTDIPIEPCDIVTCISFMLHISDPTYLLKYLASISKKYIMLVSLFPHNDNYEISYGTDTSKFANTEFPCCFDTATTVSDSLLYFGLKELGFNTTIEVKKQPHWILRRKDWRCFIAIRD